MKKLVCFVVGIFTIISVSGKPSYRSQNGNYTDGPENECQAVVSRERCSRIFIDAVSGDAYKGLRYSLQYYCRKIPDFIPCLEENRADYMLLMECQEQVMVLMNTWVTSLNLTPDDLFDLSINLLDAVNNIVCSRTDEFYDLVECVKDNDREFQPNFQRCLTENLSSIMNFMQAPNENPLASQESVLCGSLYGFGSCVRDTMAGICEGSTDILDTFFDDVVVGVIVDGLGCEPQSNPLLSFVRSVRNKLRR